MQGATVDRWLEAWRDSLPRHGRDAFLPPGKWLDKGENDDSIKTLTRVAGTIARTIDDGTITHSKNVFVPVSRRCINDCGYCNFKNAGNEREIDVFSLEALHDLVMQAKSHGCTEVLLCGGERADTFPGVQAAIKADGIESGSMIDWLLAACEIITRHDLLPHVNVGLLDDAELTMLKPWNASMGLMLESSNPALPVHERSPGKDPARRLAMIDQAGRLHIPFTSGLLLGIGETMDDVITSLDALRRVHMAHGHLQEIIIQGVLPGPGKTTGNYGEVPSKARLLACVALARIAMPAGVSIQVPPNLVGENHVIDFLRAGASDIGGISPVTPDHVNPGAPWPAVEGLTRRLAAAGFTLAERLAVYPRFLAARDDFVHPRVRRIAERLSSTDASSRVT